MIGIAKTAQRPYLYRHLGVLLMLLITSFLTTTTDAFGVATLENPKSTSSSVSSVSLHAWSVPRETSFSWSTWYNTYNPTARAMVYNDPSPVERFSFVSLGNDWPSSYAAVNAVEEEADEVPAVRPKRWSNPLKRAWRRRSLRRILARRSQARRM